MPAASADRIAVDSAMMIADRIAAHASSTMTDVVAKIALSADRVDLAMTPIAEAETALETIVRSAAPAGRAMTVAIAVVVASAMIVHNAARGALAPISGSQVATPRAVRDRRVKDQLACKSREIFSMVGMLFGKVCAQKSAPLLACSLPMVSVKTTASVK